MADQKTKEELLAEFASDMEVVRKYRHAKGEMKSMPTLFEVSRPLWINRQNRLRIR